MKKKLQPVHHKYATQSVFMCIYKAIIPNANNAIKSVGPLPPNVVVVAAMAELLLAVLVVVGAVFGAAARDVGLSERLVVIVTATTTGAVAVFSGVRAGSSACTTSLLLR